MYRVRQFESPVEANSAAAWLLRHGVLAAVVGEHAASLGPYAGLTSQHGTGSHTVAIALERQRTLAVELLAVFDAEPAEFENGWEDLSTPDLGLLDPALIPPCPACGGGLRTAAHQCPQCGAEVDTVALIVRAHGPEVIEPVLATRNDSLAAELLGDDILMAMAADCAGCGYPLDGLARSGQCPECGARYDKARIVDTLGRGG